MAMAALRPNVVDFMQMTALEGSGLGIEEVQVPPKCRFSGKTLADSGMKAKYGVNVIGIEKGNQKLQINVMMVIINIHHIVLGIEIS